MKIIFIADDLSGSSGGWSRYAAELTKSLVERGHDVCAIVHIESDLPPIRQYALLDSPLRYLVNPLRAYVAARRVIRVIEKERPDIVHIAVEPYIMLMSFLRINVPVFLTIHGTYAYFPRVLQSRLKRRISSWLANRAYRKLAGVIAVSSFTRDHFIAYCGNLGEQLKARIGVIPNGVILPKQNPIFGMRKLNTPPVFLYVGGVKERKGVLEAVDVMDVYRNIYGPDFSFRIIGSIKQSPQYVEEVKKRIMQHNLSAQISIEGTIDDNALIGAYRDASAFIMLSRPSSNTFEGFGLVYLEANSYGVPVVGTYGSGTVDAIKDGRSGFLVKRGNARDAAIALHNILFDKHLRTYSYEWARAHEWRVIARLYEAQYEACVPALVLLPCNKKKKSQLIHPTVSIVMIVKNEIHNVKSFLQSIKYLADELIVIDTGSSDGTVNEFNDSENPFPVHISSLKIDPFHFGRAKNEAIRRATSDYIFLLDADERPSNILCSTLKIFLRDADPEVLQLPRVDELVPSYIDLQIRIWKRRDNLRYGEDEQSQVHESLITTHAVRIFNAPILHMQGKNHWLRRPWRVRQQLSMEIQRAHLMRHPLEEFLHAPLGFFYKFRSVYIRRMAYRDGLNGFMYAVLKGLYVFYFHIGVGLKAYRE